MTFSVALVLEKEKVYYLEMADQILVATNDKLRAVDIKTERIRHRRDSIRLLDAIGIACY
ncbi:hypothetical protein B1no1_29320 [Thermolongibacillus altinsuensis]|nr:hypothetical protein B1no1_29320 [Thermolongibacillus altinsuensis]